jgi:hypothetical protein
MAFDFEKDFTSNFLCFMFNSAKNLPDGLASGGNGLLIAQLSL